jgi:hypothetical protein
MIGDTQMNAVNVQWKIRCGGDEIPSGTFHGDDKIPPGTFHGGDEIPPGTFHGGNWRIVGGR